MALKVENQNHYEFVSIDAMSKVDIAIEEQRVMSLPDSDPIKWKAIDEVASEYLRRDHHSTKFEQLLAEEIRVAQLIKDETEQKAALSKIQSRFAHLNCREGALGKAESAAQSVFLREPEKSEVLLDISQEYTSHNSKGQFIPDLDRAIEIARSISDLESKCRALNNIARSYIKTQNFAEARQFLSEAEELVGSIAELEKKVEVLSAIANTYSDIANAKEKRKELLEMAEKIALSIPNEKDKEYPYPKSYALKVIADDYRVSGDLEEAEKVALQIPSPNFKNAILSDIAKAYIRANNLKAAEIVAEQIIDFPYVKGESMNYLFSKSDVLLSIVEAWIRLGKLQEAERIANAMQISDAHNPFKTFALCFIAQHHISIGNLVDAERIAKLIADCKYKSSTLRYIAETYCKVNQFDQAERVAKLIDDSEKKSLCLIDVAKELLKTKNSQNIDKALELLSYAQTFIPLIKQEPVEEKKKDE
jgi:tetratricopeptide (TPR) repeat protein